MEKHRSAYSISEVAERNGVSRQFVRQQIRRGILTAKKLGRRTIILADAEQEWLEAAPTVKPVGE